MTIERIDANSERFYRELDDVMPEIDPITFEIIKNRLESIANEMGVTVHSTAHTPIFAETKDFSCAIFDHQGRLAGMGQFLPGHQGGMQHNLDGVLAQIGWENLQEGDILMSNDALYGACHPPDLVLFHPIFLEHEIIGFAGCIVHHIDMGGMAPSSYCPKATELYQEGVRFPPGTKLYEAGKLREDILNIFLTNVRLPEAQYGDLMAQVAGCHVAARRIRELAEQYGAAKLKNSYEFIQHYAARMVRNLFSRMRPGVYYAEDYVEGDGVSDQTYAIKCTMTVQADRIIVDFSGTDQQARGFINSQWGNTSANVYSPVMARVPECPRCYGATVPVEIIAAKGTLVNPHPTAAIGACTTESGHIIHNVVWHCLSQAYPEGASGIWSGAFSFQLLWGTNPRTDKYFIALLESPGCGGGGARKDLDGWPVGSSKAANVTLPNVELEEAQWPLAYQYRRLCRDDDFPGSGAGRQRGGIALEYEIGPVGCTLDYTLIGNKLTHGTFGVFGGQAGHTARAEIRDALTGETREVLPTKVLAAALSEGEVLYWASAGGGGYGSPLERSVLKVQQDVIDGFVSLNTANELYGVILDPETFEIDHRATSRRRAR